MKGISFAVIIVSFLPLLTSCSTEKFVNVFGITGVIFIFIFLFFILLTIIFFIYRKWKEHKAALSISAFNQNITNIINKIHTPQEKLDALDYALERIEKNEKYDKNPKWKNNLIVSIFFHKANVYKQINDEENMLDACTRILELKPNHAKTLHSRGNIYYNLGRWNQAIDDYTESLAIEESAMVYYNRANAYMESGDKENALIDYNTFLNLYKGDDARLLNDAKSKIKDLEK